MIFRILRTPIVFALLLIPATAICKKLDSNDYPHATLASNKLEEGYSGRTGTDVSQDSYLVGALLGKEPFISNSAEVLMGAHGIEKNKVLCLKVTTRDGLFWSDNPFKIPQQSKFLVGPVAYEYARVFNNYPVKDVLIRGTIHSNIKCNDTESNELVVPAVGEVDGTLRIFLLTHDQAAGARIWKADNPGEKITVRCGELSSGSLIVADKECKFELPPNLSPGKVNLQIRIKGRFEHKDLHYDLLLPSTK